MSVVLGVMTPRFRVPATTVPTPGTLNVSSIRNSAGDAYTRDNSDHDSSRREQAVWSLARL